MGRITLHILHRLRLAVGLSTVDCLASLLDLLEDLFVGEVLVSDNGGCLCVEGDIV